MYAERIKELRARAAKLYEQAEALEAVCEGEDREPTKDEQEVLDGFERDAEALVRRVERLEQSEQRAAAKRAKPMDLADPVDDDDQVPAGSAARAGDGKLPEGGIWAYCAHLAYVTKGNRRHAMELAQEQGHHAIAKMYQLPEDRLQEIIRDPEYYQRAAVLPGTTTDSTFASALVSVNHMAAAFIDMLRPNSVVQNLPLFRTRFDRHGSAFIPREDGQVSGGWVGEGDPAAIERPSFGGITLTPKKIMVITPQTAELLRRSDPAALELVTRNLVRGTRKTVDTQFCATGQATDGPDGIFYGLTPITANADTGLVGAVADMKGADAALVDADVEEGGWHWLARGKVNTALQYMLDGNGNMPFRGELASGRLSGHQTLFSNVAVADSLALLAARSIVMAEDLAPEVSITTEAALEMSSAPTGDLSTPEGTSEVVSLWQRDMVGIKLTWAMDWAPMHAAARAIVTSIAWQ